MSDLIWVLRLFNTAQTRYFAHQSAIWHGMTRHDTAFVFASFNTLLCLTWTLFIVYMEQKKILIRHASWHAATVLTKISFVYRAKIACPCHHHYAGNPVEGHKWFVTKAGRQRFLQQSVIGNCPAFNSGCCCHFMAHLETWGHDEKITAKISLLLHIKTKGMGKRE